MDAEIKIKYKDGSREVRRYSSQKKCDKNNTIQVKISNTIQVKMKLNKNTDSDIMEWLEGQPSKAQSRAPLENHKISSEKQKKR